MPSTKRKAAAVKMAEPISKKSAKGSIKPRINDARVHVSSVWKGAVSQQQEGDATIEISSDSDSGDDEHMDDEEDEDEKVDVAAKANGQPLLNGHSPMANGGAAAADDEDASDNEPTFGELVREQETVDVAAILDAQRQEPGGDRSDADAESRSLLKANTPGSAVAQPSLASLGNLLNAALRSGDDANLEVCFNMTTDLTWVRNTIQRLDPALAGPLLQKLSARMHRRPGRAHTLIGWVQWTLITHGGALASQPGVSRSLQELHRVLEERARGLNSLLLLKGKLDMLEAQMQLRRGQRLRTEAAVGASALDGDRTSATRHAASEGKRRRGRGRLSGDDGLDFGVTTYVEGEEDGETDNIRINGAVAVGGLAGDSDEEEDLEDHSGDSDEDNGDDDEILEAAEEDDIMGDDDVDFDDVDDEDDDEEDEDEAGPTDPLPPPAKMQKKSSSAFSKR